MKWYDQILATLKTYFTLSEEATESEVHATLEKAGNLDAYKAQLKTDAEAAVKAELDKSSSDLQAAQKALQESQEANKSLQADLDKAKAQITELEKRAAATPTKVKGGPDEGEETAKMPVWAAYQNQIAAL